MARLFKNNLTIDQKTGAYIWHYQWGKGLNGWTSSDNLSVNKPSYGGYKRYEDVSHGAIDVDFAYKAYKAGIVFTEEDMIRFGKTVENYLILPNGKVAQFVNGGVEAKYQIMIAHWLRISDYAPSAYPLAEKLITSLTGAGGSGMLAIAMTNLAANGGGGVIIKPQDPVENPPEQPELPVESGEIIINGGFEKNQTGWSGSLVTIKTESNGNKYLTNGYNWQAYQDLNLSAGEYKLTAKTKKLTATTQARIVLRYTDAKGNYSYENLLYSHKGTGWEEMGKTITVPAGTTAVRLYLLVNGGSGEHGFDNVSLISLQAAKPEPKVEEQIVNGEFSQDKAGWSSKQGTIKTESNGNKYLTNGYNWQAYQDLNLSAGEYKLTAKTKKLTAATEARIVLRYTDAKGNYSYENLLYSHKGAGWEEMGKTITVPAGTTAVRLYLLVNGGSGEHGFDDVSLQKIN
jgi:hypothetical protein